MVRNLIRKGAAAALVFFVAAGCFFPSGAMAASVKVSDMAGTISAAEEKIQEIEPVQVKAGDENADTEIEELEANEGAVLFAETSADAAPVSTDCSVTLSYSKIIRHEDWFTRSFTVKYNDKTKVAYCIEPKDYPPDKGVHTAVVYNNELMTKALYYSYGYPGFETVTKSYLDKAALDSDYKGEDGAYVISHLILSYFYDSEKADSDAFKGLGAATKTFIKNMAADLKNKWPAVPEDASLEIDITEVQAEWNKVKQRQETPVMQLRGHADNKITVIVPEDTILTKLSGHELSDHASGVVDIYGGDEFYFTAPASKKGTYESGKLTGVLQEFQPYIIKVSNKQDIMYCGDGAKDSVSFKIFWENIGRFNLRKISASPEITEGNENYSLKDAVYGIYDGEENLIEEITTDELGNADVMLPYGNYIMKELTSPLGYALDEDTYDIDIKAEETDFEHEEQIIPEEPAPGIPVDDTPQTGDARQGVLFVAMIIASIALMMMIVAVMHGRGRKCL